MKFKWLLLIGCLGLSTLSFADNIHVHPPMRMSDSQLADKKPTTLGYCQIEIVNGTSDNLLVSGYFDDGYYLDPFFVYGVNRSGFLGYVSLYYYNINYADFICNDSMTLYIDNTYTKRRIYSRRVGVGTSLVVNSSFNGAGPQIEEKAK